MTCNKIIGALPTCLCCRQELIKTRQKTRQNESLNLVNSSYINLIVIATTSTHLLADNTSGARGPHHEPANVLVPVAGRGAIPTDAPDVRMAGSCHQPAPPAEYQV